MNASITETKNVHQQPEREALSSEFLHKLQNITNKGFISASLFSATNTFVHFSALNFYHIRVEICFETKLVIHFYYWISVKYNNSF